MNKYNIGMSTDQGIGVCMNKYIVIRVRQHRMFVAEKIDEYYSPFDAVTVADIEKKRHPRSSIAVVKVRYIA